MKLSNFANGMVHSPT